MNLWKFGNLNFWTFTLLDNLTGGHLDFWTLGIWTFRPLNIWAFDIKRFCKSKNLRFYNNWPQIRANTIMCRVKISQWYFRNVSETEKPVCVCVQSWKVQSRMSQKNQNPVWKSSAAWLLNWCSCKLILNCHWLWTNQKKTRRWNGKKVASLLLRYDIGDHCTVCKTRDS